MSVGSLAYAQGDLSASSSTILNCGFVVATTAGYEKGRGVGNVLRVLRDFFIGDILIA